MLEQATANDQDDCGAQLAAFSQTLNELLATLESVLAQPPIDASQHHDPLAGAV